MPPMSFIRVDFPAPEWPVRKTISPSWIESDTFLRAWWPPGYRFDTCSVVIIKVCGDLINHSSNMASMKS